MRVRFEVLFLASTVASFIVVVIRLLVTEAWCLVSRVIVTSVLSSTPGWAVGPVQPCYINTRSCGALALLLRNNFFCNCSEFLGSEIFYNGAIVM